MMVKSKVASAAKIGLIYTISNLIVRGMSFFTTPFFARVMTKSEYGDFSNIVSWTTIISIIVTMQLYMSIMRAKYDYNREIDRYISSILILSNLFTLVVWGIVEVFMPVFEVILDLSSFYIRIIFVYALFSPAMQMLIYKSRIYSNYVLVVVFTWITLLTTVGGSVLLIYIMSDKLAGRTIGNYLLIAMVDAFLWIYILAKGRCISTKYWRYALRFSVPLIPHELAGQLLLSSDRIIIKKICGSEEAALYSLAYTITTMASVFLSSMNQAFQPWLFDNIDADNREAIRKASVPYTLLFAAGCIGVVLLGPEIVLFFGGEAYYDAKDVIPPVCYGVMLQFVYTMYANIEFFEKKTGWISVATFIASLVNIGLNFLLIPHMGYKAAAYTTAIGFFAMFAFHYFVVRFRTDLADIYDIRIFLIILSAVLAIAFFVAWSYNFTVVRYILVTIYVLGLGCAFIIKRKMIISMIRGKTKN